MGVGGGGGEEGEDMAYDTLYTHHMEGHTHKVTCDPELVTTVSYPDSPTPPLPI